MDPSTSPNAYELRFASLFQHGRGYAFPCDAAGSVPVESLSERGRESYLAVRSLVGREFTAPVVRRVGDLPIGDELQPQRAVDRRSIKANAVMPAANSAKAGPF